jgi:hypothetical protein
MNSTRAGLLVEGVAGLVLAAVVLAAPAAGQTVVVRSAPEGGTVELFVNASRVDSALADASGGATLRVGTAAARPARDADVHILVQSCGAVQRVVLVESGAAPPDQGGCAQRDVPDLFLMGRETSFLVDIGAPGPRVRIRQGQIPASWLLAGAFAADRTEGRRRERRPASNGLMVSGAGGVSRLQDLQGIACADIGGCQGPGQPWTATAGVSFWPAKFFGVEAGVIRPFDVKVDNPGPGLSFTTKADVRMLTLVGKVGGQAGPIRLYGLAGVNRHMITISTAQTVDASSTAAASSQTVSFKTKGWGLLVGGGGERWVLPALGIFGEGGWTAINGKSADESGGTYDDQMWFGVFGIRLRILGR